MQTFSIFSGQGAVVRPHEIWVEGSVGVLWRANGHFGKVEGCKRVGFDRCRDWRFLPGRVGVVDQHKCSGESESNNSNPEQLAIASLSVR